MPQATRSRKSELFRSRVPERTKAEILSVAVREFADHGFHGARIERISKQAKCNARMIYHYFGGKEQLYLAALDSVFDGIKNRDNKLDLQEGDPAEMVRRLVEITYDHYADNPDFGKLMRNENLLGGQYIRRSRAIGEVAQPLMVSIGELLDRGHAAGVFRRKADPVQFYLTIIAMSGHHLNNAATLGMVFDRDLADPDWIAQRRTHSIEVVLGYLGVDDV